MHDLRYLERARRQKTNPDGGVIAQKREGFANLFANRNARRDSGDLVSAGAEWKSVVRLDGSFSAGSTDALHGQGGLPGFFGDKPVLFFDHGARGSIAVEPAEDFARNSAVGSLCSVFVEHIEQNECFSRRWLSCHSPSPIIAQSAMTSLRIVIALLLFAGARSFPKTFRDHALVMRYASKAPAARKTSSAVSPDSISLDPP